MKATLLSLLALFVAGPAFAQPAPCDAHGMGDDGYPWSTASGDDEPFVQAVADVGDLATAEFGTLDSDSDGVDDRDDNCVCRANANQYDVDGDGIGNACDGDFNQNGAFGSDDYAELQSCFGLSVAQYPSCGEHDMNGDGTVGSADFSLWKVVGLGGRVGPSCCQIHPDDHVYNDCPDYDDAGDGACIRFAVGDEHPCFEEGNSAYKLGDCE